jgi:hypothetical protein
LSPAVVVTSTQCSCPTWATTVFAPHLVALVFLRATPPFWTTYDPEVVRAALKRLDAAQTP